MGLAGFRENIQALKDGCVLYPRLLPRSSKRERKGRAGRQARNTGGRRLPRHRLQRGSLKREAREMAALSSLPLGGAGQKSRKAGGGEETAKSTRRLRCRGKRPRAPRENAFPYCPAAAEGLPAPYSRHRSRLPLLPPHADTLKRGTSEPPTHAGHGRGSCGVPRYLLLAARTSRSYPRLGAAVSTRKSARHRLSLRPPPKKQRHSSLEWPCGGS